jgi:N-acyl homoserine lactone hydrolase
VRLHPLLTGHMRSPPALLEHPGGPLAVPRGLGIGRSRDNWVWLPIPAFLIEHPTAGPVLVDTGLHPSVAIDPKQNFGRVGAMLNELRMEPEQALHAQLRARDLDPADVRTIVMTHLHHDHASGVSEFPNATFVLDEREWEAAIRPRGFLRGYRTEQFDYGFDWRTVNYDAPTIASYATFGGSVDLFGDGSVRLLATPGHTEGHQSVLVRLRDREALIAADAAYMLRTIRDRVRPLLLADEHRFWRSLKEIERYVERTPDALVICGHDAEQWPTLEAIYE